VTDTNASNSYTFSNATAQIVLTLTGPDSISVTDTSAACAGTVPAGSPGKFNCADTPFSGLSATPVTGTTANYIGTGTITPTYTASGQIGAITGSGGTGSAGNVSFGGLGTIGGTFTLTYNYNPGGVPEPATMAMAGGLLIGLAALARKKRRT
jgi:hypothetical protein